jgi:hypothetical protein
MIQFMTFRAIIRAQIVIFAVERDHSELAGFVEAVIGNTEGHRECLLKASQYGTGQARLSGRTPDRREVRLSCVRRGV